MVAIDDEKALRQWLVTKLGPICDADPVALAKYVVALIKKDKSENDLITSCKEQLDVFLQKETNSFVDGLFSALNSKNYLKSEDVAASDETESVPPSSVLHESTRTPMPSEETSSMKERIADSTSSRSYRARSRSKSPKHKHRSPVESRRRYHDDRRYHRPRRSPDRNDRRYRRKSRSISPRRNSPPRRRVHRSPMRRSRSPINQRLSPSHRSRSPLQSNKRSRSRSKSSDGHSSSPDPIKIKMDPDAKKKQRCWDYDQKGFCMKGDHCPFDHGNDAVVVDDLSLAATEEESTNKSLPSSQTMQAVPSLPIPPPLMSMPPMQMVPPMGLPPPPHLMHRFPPPPINMSIPPPNMLPPPVQVPPPYNPELPSLSQSDKRNQSESRRIVAAPIYNKDEEFPGTRTRRNDYNSAGGTKVLVVQRIPTMLNNITKLNEHFAKFGAINNIQVKYNSESDQALIEYAHHTSAKAAITDKEAVLGNRFIRILWFREGNNYTSNQTKKDTKPNIQSRLGRLPDPSKMRYTAPGIDDPKKTAMDGTTLTRTITNPDVHTSDDSTAQNSSSDPKEDAEAKEKLLAAKQAAKQKSALEQQQVLQKKIDIQKKRQGLMKNLVDQQKLLLTKLEASKTMPASEKQNILKALKSLKACINNLNTNPNAQTKKVAAVKEKEEKQKNLLDAEMDLFNASTAGENTFSLKRKLNQLKMEAKSISLVNWHQRGSWGRGRGRAMSRGYHPYARGRSTRYIRSGANLDRRPCELRVSGFSEEEKDEVVAHFSEFGEVDTFKFDPENNTMSLKFKMRSDAEQAASSGIVFKKRNLVIVWANSNTKVTPEPLAAVKDQNANLSPTAQLLLAPKKEASDGEDDDDDGEEDISVTVDQVAFNPPSLNDEDEFGYDGLLDDELDEEALLAADIEEEESWRS